MKKKRTYQEVALQWLEDKRLYVKQSTYGIYCLHLEKHILPVFGSRYALSESDVQKWVNSKLEQGLSLKSVKDILLVLKMSLRYGQKKGVFPAAPPLEIRFPTPRSGSRLSVLTVEQQRRLWAYLRKHPTTFNLGVALCLHTGLRIGELCALTWADLDLNEGLVRVHKTLQRLYVVEPQHRGSCLVLDSPKTAESNRVVPISHEILTLLRRANPDNLQGFLLTGNGTPMEPRSCRRRFKRLLEQLNLPPIRFHGLRHSFATRCIESACDVKTVSALLGHANIGTTLNYYVHPDLIQKKKAVEQMSRYIG